MAYQVLLREKKVIADDTFAIFLAKPARFKFQAGQFLQLKIPQLTETPARNFRPFSIASAPFEPELLLVTRKGKSTFKQTLAKLTPGDKVEIIGPLGKFTLQEDTTKPAVFLAGGIGITPIRSILKDAHYRKLTHKFYLFYSNRRPETAPFLEELQHLEPLDYQFIGTMTDPPLSEAEWAGERDYISIPLLQKYITNLTQPIYYIVGPPSFVQTIKTALRTVQVPEEQIRQESFAGYL